MWWPRFVSIPIGVELILLVYIVISRASIGDEFGLPFFDGFRQFLFGDSGLMPPLLQINLFAVCALWAASLLERQRVRQSSADLAMVLLPALVLLSLSFVILQLAHSVAPLPVSSVIERAQDGTYVTRFGAP